MLSLNGPRDLYDVNNEEFDGVLQVHRALGSVGLQLAGHSGSGFGFRATEPTLLPSLSWALFKVKLAGLSRKL